MSDNGVHSYPRLKEWGNGESGQARTEPGQSGPPGRGQCTPSLSPLTLFCLLGEACYSVTIDGSTGQIMGQVGSDAKRQWAACCIERLCSG